MKNIKSWPLGAAVLALVAAAVLVFAGAGAIVVAGAVVFGGPKVMILLLIASTMVPWVMVIASNLILPEASDPPYPICKTCGYNLTGNTSGVCPECGEGV